MGKPAFLIYDGDCAFCQLSLQWGIDHLAWFPPYVAFQKINPIDFGLTEAQVRSQIFVVDGDKTFGGHRAGAWILTHQPNAGTVSFLWRGFGHLINFFSPISALVYRWVAANRHRLPGGSATCKLEDNFDPKKLG